MIHLLIGGELTTKSKTGCGLVVYETPRNDSVVTYGNRHYLNCQDCIEKAKKIEKMKGDKSKW